MRQDGAPHELAIALLRESRATGTLEHPGVVPVHALGVDARGQTLLVMKRVEGKDFSELLAEPAHPPWLERQGKNVDRLTAKLEIDFRVSRTVEFAHGRAHRAVTRRGEARRIGAGARLTSTAVSRLPQLFFTPENTTAAPA